MGRLAPEKEVRSAPKVREHNRRAPKPATPRREEDCGAIEHEWQIGHDCGLMMGFIIGLVTAIVGISVLALVVFTV
jgi:hypothetical protein